MISDHHGQPDKNKLRQINDEYYVSSIPWASDLFQIVSNLSPCFRLSLRHRALFMVISVVIKHSEILHKSLDGGRTDGRNIALDSEKQKKRILKRALIGYKRVVLNFHIKAGRRKNRKRFKTAGPESFDPIMRAISQHNLHRFPIAV